MFRKNTVKTISTKRLCFYGRSVQTGINVHRMFSGTYTVIMSPSKIGKRASDEISHKRLETVEEFKPTG